MPSRYRWARPNWGVQLAVERDRTSRRSFQSKGRARVRELGSRAGSDWGLCALIRATELTSAEAWSRRAGVADGFGALLKARRSPLPAS